MIKINRHILSNGLRVVHCKTEAAKMVAVNVLYCVGSRNESEQHTGMAHLFEHLMFGGSKNAPDFDLSLQMAGGENNAWTSDDITNFYEVLPVVNIETAFWLEADRMMNLLLTDKSFEVQKSVVMEEFKQRCLNVPYGDVGHLWRDLVYKVHPYKWPVIGKELSHIENVDKETLINFYNRYYSPDNAILSVVGDIEADEVFALAEKWFGHIRPFGGDKLVIPQEPLQTEARTLCVEHDVPVNTLLRYYRMPDRFDPEYVPCDLISDILANGRSSRFQQNIVSKGKLVSSLDASITGSLDSGVLIIKAALLPDANYKDVEAAIDTELDKLLNGDVKAWELGKVANKFESNSIFSNINCDECASNMAYCEMLGDVELMNTQPALYHAVTEERFKTTCQNILRKENCSTLYYMSKAN